MPSSAIPIEFGSINENNVGILRILNHYIFPVKYNDKFYKDILSTPAKYTKFGKIDSSATTSIKNRVMERTYHVSLLMLNPLSIEADSFVNGYVVAAICCRLEPLLTGSKEKGKKRLYIMTLGVLEQYRHKKIGKQVLENVVAKCEVDKEIDSIYLHVQTSNVQAIEFYSKFGFEITDTIRNYYKRIIPPDCYILSKKIN